MPCRFRSVKQNRGMTGEQRDRGSMVAVLFHDRAILEQAKNGRR